MKHSLALSLISLSPLFGGERVRVRGFLDTPTRGESPSPGAQGRADLSPQAGRGEDRRVEKQP